MNWDEQPNTHNASVQSIGITITPVGCVSWENQDEMKQKIPCASDLIHLVSQNKL